MKKLLFFMAFGVGLLLMPNQSEAQVGGTCSGGPTNINIDGDRTSPAATHTCVTDAIGMEYTFKALGVCEGFPDYANGLDNCYTVFNQEVDVDLLTSNTPVAVDGFMPPAGTYDHFFAVTGNTFSLRGELTFNQAYLSLGSGGAISEGQYCRPNGSYKTSLIANVDPDDLSGALNSLSGGLPMICQSSSSQAGNLTVEIDNVGVRGQSSTLNISGNQWEDGVDENSPVNVVLLDANLGVAANADAVQDVLFIKKAATDLTIDAETNFDVTFDKEGAFQLYYACDPNLAETVNQLPGVSVNTNSDCIMLGATLGENAFTPGITIN